MVGQQPLKLFILVRIQVPEQKKKSGFVRFFLLFGNWIRSSCPGAPLACKRYQAKVNDLVQKAGTPAVESVPAVVNNQTLVPAAVSNVPSSEVANDPATKGWLTFINKNLNYQFKYPKDFFHPVDSFGVKIRDCDVTMLISECRTDKSKGAPWVNKEIKEINGHQFCLETRSEGAAGSLFTIYDYVNVNGAKCGDLKLVVQTHNCDMYDGSDAIKCQNNNNVVVPETLSKVESTFSFK